MTKSTKKIVITVVVMIVVAAAVIFGYFQMTNQQSDEDNAATATTEIEKLLKKDMENNYPGTPREVMKLHGRITKCMYNDDLNQEQIEGLLEQARKLYDDELLAENPWDSHLEALMNDIADYRENKRIIMSYTAQKSSQIKIQEMDGQEYAITYLLYITQDKNTSFAESCEKFILRKDANNNWKIVGWELADPESVEIEAD